MLCLAETREDDVNTKIMYRCQEKQISRFLAQNLTNPHPFATVKSVLPGTPTKGYGRYCQKQCNQAENGDPYAFCCHTF